MKHVLITIGLAAMTIAGANAQTVWNYNFGTGTGNFTSGASTSFLPAPQTNGGTARVRVGTGSGKFELANPGSSLGSGSELVVTAPTTSSATKYSIYDFTAGKSYSLQFEMILSGGSSGTFYLFAGDGATYSNNSTFSGSEVFTGVQWVFGASNAITTNYRSGGSWMGLSGTPFAQNTSYNVQIFGNNGLSSINYTLGGVNSLAPNTWDLWIGGVKVGTNLGKAQLANDANIDSFMFYGENSAGNVAQLTLDNITYANYAIPEPGTWLLIGLGSAVILARLRSKKA